MSELKNKVRELLQESSQFNTNDVLVHADLDNPKLFSLHDTLNIPLDVFPKSILREAEKSRRESGINSLCLAEGFVELTINEKQVITPILLHPLSYSVDKIKQLISLEVIADEAFVNPFLTNYLAEKNQVLNTADDLVLEELEAEMSNKGLTISSQLGRVVGNFHHHRFEVLKELDDLLQEHELTPHLQALFGFDTQQTSHELKLADDQILASDTDHEAVFEAAKHENLVIQGPPGTGKSQVLTNLLAKCLAQGHTSVFVSEKRAALEVIQKKLSPFGLDRLCFIATSNELSHSFLNELKANWDFFERYSATPVNNLRLSEQHSDHLQMTLDLLNQPALIGEVSYHDFLDLSDGLSFENAPYSSDVVSIVNFKKHRDAIELAYAKNLSKVLGSLKQATLQSDDFGQLDVRLADWQLELNELQRIFELTTWGDTARVMKKAAQCQVYENDLFKQHAELFKPDSKAQKRFLKLRTQYLKLSLELEHFAQEESHWKIVPSMTETLALREGLTGGFFVRKRTKKRWASISHLPFQDADKSLNQHRASLELRANYSQLLIKFCELGIENPEKEINPLFHTIGQYNADTWAELALIPADQRSELTRYHRQLNSFYHDLKSYFQFESDQVLSAYFEDLQHALPILLPERATFSPFDDTLLRSLRRNKDAQSFHSELLHSHWVRFKERFPTLATFTMNELSTKVQSICVAEEQEALLFSKEILNAIHAQYSSYHELLNTPARKLDEEQKALKVELRKGKSLLVKEFAKSMRHPSLRELYNSEARKWIQLLKPIWLSNPAQLAKCFPMERKLFDLAIFDEASQIPIQNALGALQRSKRAIVAGDEHQMGPSSYFKSGSSEPMDLLHQASFYWQKTPLKHHYRSAHPDLIAFSNSHFYGNSLAAFPSANAASPLHHHYLPEGRFVDRQNLTEATAIAERAETYLKEGKSIGVVAFSEEQLSCIWDKLSPGGQELVNTCIDENRGFFKALENVQGDECDHLLISFGYGKNEAGEFHLRFGPMNTANGRRRLNVLLTRAIHSIDFYCSILSSDFKLSDNESINLLRQWVAFSENYSTGLQQTFPFDLSPDINGKELTFRRIQTNMQSAKELVTLERVLEQRGWHINYR